MQPDRSNRPEVARPTDRSIQLQFETSCFANRVRGIDPFSGSPADAIERFLSSAAVLMKRAVFEPLMSGYNFMRFSAMNEIVIEAHDAAAMALGRQALFSYTRHIIDDDDCYAEDALNYLTNRRQPAVERLSFLELLLCAAEPRFGPRLAPVAATISDMLQAQSLRLIYRNGRFDPSDGPAVEQAVHDPFWDLIVDARWDNVRTDMQQALALRDNGGPNPALYAARALESTVKIISGQKGWLTGRERGAANVIDTLVSARNGRFIEPWEAEMLKRFFADVRNPDAHGAGAAPQPQLTPVQTSWAIEFCMISIKSLLQRL
ncbi:MAG: hypothetical protein WC704_16100 [Sphingomonas sp.]|jgi:hypothetical protein